MKKFLILLFLNLLFVDLNASRYFCTTFSDTAEDTIEKDSLPWVDPRAFIAKDRNTRIEEATDLEFNYDKNAFVVNGVFMRDLIGIDQNNMNITWDFTYPVVVRHIGKGDDSLVIKKDPLDDPDFRSGTIKLRNMRLRNIIFFTYSGNSHFMTPDDIRQKYCPQAKGPYLYMINKFFIMRDEDLYMIDPDFIQSSVGGVLPLQGHQSAKGRI